MVDPNCGTVKGYWRYVQLSTSELFDDQLKYRFASSKEKEKQGIFSVVVDIRGLKGDSLKKAKLDYIPMLAQAVDVVVLTEIDAVLVVLAEVIRIKLPSIVIVVPVGA